MSGMQSHFSSSVTGDKQHSYAVLSALLQGSAAEGSQTQSSSSQRERQSKDYDAASVPSFGSSVSLLKDRLHYKSSSSKKTSSLVARQRAAEDANAQVLKNQSNLWASSVRNDM